MINLDGKIWTICLYNVDYIQMDIHAANLKPRLTKLMQICMIVKHTLFSMTLIVCSGIF